MKNIKIIAALAISSLLSQAAIAQVSYKLSLMGDKKTYLVSMVSEKTWKYPQNLTSTAQVTIKVPSDRAFTPIVSSADNNVLWRANSILEKPSNDPAHTYISFGLESIGTAKIDYIEGVEIPLFTFTSKEKGCSGIVALLNNTKDVLIGEEANNNNIGNQITVLGGKGNVYIGNLDASVDCNSITATTDLKEESSMSLYPIPADDVVNLVWNNPNTKNATIQVLVENLQGRVVQTQNISHLKGKNQVTIPTQNLMPGLYTVAIKDGNAVSQWHKIMVVH
jgi:Secretion system C-terminal sorting domain